MTTLGVIGTGAGEAQIFQGNKGLDVLLRRQQFMNQNLLNKRYYDQMLQRQQHQRDQELLKSDFNKPGTFQQEESLREIGAHKKKTYDMALKNPHLSGLEIKQALAEDESTVNSNIAKRNEAQDIVKQHQQEYLKDRNKFDTNAMTKLRSSLLYDVDPNGRLIDKHINNINTDELRAMNSHPSAYNVNALVTDSLGPIKSQMTYAPEGTIINTPFGQLEKTQQHGVRFKNIGETTNFLIHSDPRIENKAYWQVAEDQLRANGEDPSNLNRVQEVYNQIRTDPKFNSLVYDKVEPVVRQLQTEVNKKYTRSIGTYTQAQKEGTSVQEDHYKVTNDQMQALNNLATTKEIPSMGFPIIGKVGNIVPKFFKGKIENPEFLNAQVPIPSDNKWDGKEIQSATTAYKDNKPVIRLVLKEGTSNDLMGNKKPFTTVHDIPVDMKNPEYFNYMKHNHGKKLAEKMNENAYLKWKENNANFEKGAFDDL